MKEIKNTPVRFDFISLDNKKGYLEVTSLGDFVSYCFDIYTDTLYRMKDSRDNMLELFLDGRWESFTPALQSTRKDAQLELELLENNNKGTHYRLTINIEGPLPKELDAKAEGLTFA